MALLADLVRDFRYAGRSLARTPGFTVVAVAVLALGIGATSAIFSLVSAVWLKPLPFADAERIVTLWLDATAFGGPPRSELSPAHYVDWQTRAQSFESIAPIEVGSFNLTGDGGEPERLLSVRTTSNLFDTIGLMPLLGRTFAPDDGASEAVVVSEGFWLRRLGGDPAAVGRTITLDGSPHTVVGVVPRDFRFPAGEIDVFVATEFSPAVLARNNTYYWYLVAKLKPGVTAESARAEMRVISAALGAESPNTGRGAAVTIVPLREQLVSTRTPSLTSADPSTLTALLGAVALVLLIACANVANLLLARATVRQKELAIRKALGAGRGRVLRQLLAESCVIAALGVVVGLGIAAACFGYLTRLMPSTLPASTSITLDGRVLMLTIAAACVTVALFGAGPAFAAARRDFGAAFGRTVGTHGTRARRLRTTLVVAEIALTVVLLSGAGLLLRSYRAVLAVETGFNAEGLLVAETALPNRRYPDAASRTAFYQRVLERVRALPGVENAGYTNFAPLLFKGGRSLAMAEGRPRPEPPELVRNLASNRGASPGYLEALGVPLISGRFIDARDTADAAPVVVINESLARAQWPDEDPLGHRLNTGGLLTVVGVVGDMRQMGLDVPADPELYVPIDQVGSAFFMGPRQLVVRTSGDPLSLVSAVRRAIWDVDPDQPVSSVRAMSEVVDAELGNRNTQLTLTGAFALVALVLAAVGLYGVLSYTVSQSTNEIGLRMALGAEQRTVVGTVVRSALTTALVGIGVGLLAASALTRMIDSFLYGVSPTDPATAAAVAGALLLVAGLAALIPAMRAARVNPMTALRADG
jgi:putative ABC transport system permease protein